MNQGRIRKFLLLNFGCMLFAVAYIQFFSENNIVPGGISGLSVVLSSIFDFSFGFFNLSINIPAMILGLLVLGSKKIAMTVYAIFFTSVFVDLGSAVLGGGTENLFVATIIGGLLYGTGTGLVYRAGGSAGGTALIGQIIHVKFPTFRLGIILFLVDGVIVLFSFLVFRNILLALMSALAVLLTSLAVDQIMEPRSITNRLWAKATLAFRTKKRQDTGCAEEDPAPIISK